MSKSKYPITTVAVLTAILAIFGYFLIGCESFQTDSGTESATSDHSNSISIIRPTDFSYDAVSKSFIASRTLNHLVRGEKVLVVAVHGEQNEELGNPYHLQFKGEVVRLDGDIAPIAPELSESKDSLLQNSLMKTHLRRLEKNNNSIQIRSAQFQGAAIEAVKRLNKLKKFGRCQGPYTIGSTRCEIFISDANEKDQKTPVTLKYVSPQALWFVDDEDLNEFSREDFQILASSLEDRSIPVIIKYFGNLPDVDQNEKLHIVLSRKLLSGKISGKFGYVQPADFFPIDAYSPTSNEGDYLYLATPSMVVANTSYSREDYFQTLMPATIVHELKHLVAGGTRLLSAKAMEPSWLEEPSAVAAEMLARSSLEKIATRAQYALKNPSNFRIASLWTPTADDAVTSMYGFNFLFLWRIAEQKGHAQFWWDWTHGELNGIKNLEHASLDSRAFPELLMDWALTLYFDHRGGFFSKQYNYQSLNLRDQSFWAPLGVQPLSRRFEGNVGSFAYFSGVATGGDVLLQFSHEYPNEKPYFLIVRH